MYYMINTFLIFIWSKTFAIFIIKLNSSYEICYKEKSLNSLCLALYDLASAFSTFYNNHNVAKESDLIKKASYISLLKLVKDKLEQGLNILAIEIPSKM